MTNACPAVKAQLTARQHEILKLFAQGMSYKQAGKHLNLSPETVKEHASNLYRRLGVHNKAQAIALGFDRQS